MKIKDIKTALAIFEEASIKHAEATECGDYKVGNKAYKNITSAINYLKNENELTGLKSYLTSPYIGVRLWSASFWLTVNEPEGIMVLEDIIKTPGIHSFTAEMTLSEWMKGNLKM